MLTRCWSPRAGNQPRPKRQVYSYTTCLITTTAHLVQEVTHVLLFSFFCVSAGVSQTEGGGAGVFEVVVAGCWVKEVILMVGGACRAGRSPGASEGVHASQGLGGVNV